MRSFVVFDMHKRAYIQSVDTYDGDTEYTREKSQARIFVGETWREFWSGDRYRLQNPYAITLDSTYRPGSGDPDY
jgi:hypothetical protein